MITHLNLWLGYSQSTQAPTHFSEFVDFRGGAGIKHVLGSVNIFWGAPSFPRRRE
jgi:hypothetical protein